MPVKFQRNRSKTVGGDTYTRYLLLKWGGGGGVEGLKGGIPNTLSSSLFFEKAGDNKYVA